MRFWRAILKDGKEVSENDSKNGSQWPQINKQIEHLELDNNGQRIILPKGMEYIQGKTASYGLSNGKCEIESRYIGIYKNGIKFIIRIDEKSNNITIEIN